MKKTLLYTALFFLATFCFTQTTLTTFAQNSEQWVTYVSSETGVLMTCRLPYADSVKCYDAHPVSEDDSEEGDDEYTDNRYSRTTPVRESTVERRSQTQTRRYRRYDVGVTPSYGYGYGYGYRQIPGVRFTYTNERETITITTTGGGLRQQQVYMDSRGYRYYYRGNTRYYLSDW